MKAIILEERNTPSRYWESSLPILLANGVEAVFATVRAAGEIHERLSLKNIRSIGFGAESVRDYPRVARQLAELAKAEGFDIVHASESIPAFIAGLSALWGNPAKRIFSRQHNILHGKQRILSFLGSHSSHLIMPVSESSGESARVYDKVSLKKIKVGYSGIEGMRPVSREEIDDLRKKLGIPDSAKVISMVSRLRPEKGHETLMRASENIASSIGCPLHLVFTGNGDDESRLRELAAAGNGYVTHFVGHQSDVALWFSLGDVVAMPSYHEAFGLSAVEAMSCGRPLIASNVGGLPEIIEDGKSGLLVQAGDEKALAAAIVSVLMSPDRARDLGEQARKRVLEKFTVDKMVEGWIDCYEFVLQR